MQAIWHSNSPWGYLRVIQFTWSEDADAIFPLMKAEYIGWRKEEGKTIHAIAFCTTVSRKGSSRQVTKDICHLWNTDEEIGAFRPAYASLEIMYGLTRWIGASTAKDPLGKTRIDAELLPYDYALEMKNLVEEEPEVKAAKAPDGRVRLPRGIKGEIAKYLALELWNDPGLRANRLLFEGEFDVAGIPTQFWRYATSDGSESGWATVARHEANYRIAMTNELPEQGRLRPIEP